MDHPSRPWPGNSVWRPDFGQSGEALTAAERADEGWSRRINAHADRREDAHDGIDQNSTQIDAAEKPASNERSVPGANPGGIAPPPALPAFTTDKSGWRHPVPFAEDVGRRSSDPARASAPWRCQITLPRMRVSTLCLNRQASLTFAAISRFARGSRSVSMAARGRSRPNAF